MELFGEIIADLKEQLTRANTECERVAMGRRVENLLEDIKRLKKEKEEEVKRLKEKNEELKEKNEELKEKVSAASGQVQENRQLLKRFLEENKRLYNELASVRRTNHRHDQRNERNERQLLKRQKTADDDGRQMSP